jgi:hypothetical protein
MLSDQGRIYTDTELARRRTEMVNQEIRKILTSPLQTSLKISTSSLPTSVNLH